MTRRRTRHVLTTAVLGAATLAGLTVTGQPASATAFPWGISLYTGSGLTGTQTVVDLDDTSCHNLSEPALSAVDVSDSDLYAYYNPDCRTGLPGQSGDSYVIVGSLHSAEFALPVVSYRVVHNN
ncbi:hypothetical protein AB0E75_13130 [Streptomyces griseoviridis]|uniref:Uncharacterized protein n=3 Tax=Streptomyces TaxID=1883 RepID=A0A918LIS3_STRGD|nr:MULTISPECIES: hypothetical protein [Streptomyces]MDP9680309.1 hypothetical protein [Streptomyces griseoviridis]GGS55537.1 hypothetical protein GCM10010238_51180 [Streptomyces niveoruber]GGT09537.1 hypothetical protein GCM10010240_48700 [Streptomyces griseoviridis]GGU52974.1 hypothetical protein GCM10010259_50370 [Streptomyces daghestanicus]GHI29176.1 hypothetical protein Sdagh_09060 [Streptomyces daghestanicus]